jgi:hypothetical protein
MSPESVKEDATFGNGTDAHGLPLPGWLLDKESKSVTRCHKPVWYFMLQTRNTKQKFMRKISQLYRTAPEICWEEKWARVEAECREARPEFFADDSQLDNRIERLTDPNIFADCSTEEEKKAALIGRAGSVASSPVFRSSNSDREAGIGSPVTENDEAGMWEMLVQSCEKASAVKMKVRSRRTAARGGSRGRS